MEYNQHPMQHKQTQYDAMYQGLLRVLSLTESQRQGILKREEEQDGKLPSLETRRFKTLVEMVTHAPVPYPLKFKKSTRRIDFIPKQPRKIRNRSRLIVSLPSMYPSA